METGSIVSDVIAAVTPGITQISDVIAGVAPLAVGVVIVKVVWKSGINIFKSLLGR